MRKPGLILLLICVLSGPAGYADDKLTIVKAGPVGEVANLAEANEIRVVFSQPMVPLGKIPKVVAAPFFHITPAVKGTFRWSGTTTLIFTPDPKTPLPFATKFDVSIDAHAKSVSGKSLDRAYNFSFITPTIRLLSTNWERKKLRTKEHPFTEPAAPQQPSDEYKEKLDAAEAAANFRR